MEVSLYEKLLNSALRFVSYRPRSEKELKDFLQKKLHRWKTAGSATVAKVVERMRELGYIDDKKFAAWWREQRETHRPKGRRIVALELSAKGISRDTIEAVLGTGNEKEAARRAAIKRLRLWHHLPEREMRQKLYQFLLRRGFDADVIARVIDEILKKDYNGGS